MSMQPLLPVVSQERTRMEVRSFVGNGVRNPRSVPCRTEKENLKFECFQKFREHYAVHLNDHTVLCRDYGTAGRAEGKGNSHGGCLSINPTRQ